jgi:hypothetical protein
VPREARVYLYVKLPNDRVGVLERVNSKDERGKYAVLLKGDTEVTYHNEVTLNLTKEEYDYVSMIKPTKQPAKRGSKKP